MPTAWHRRRWRFLARAAGLRTASVASSEEGADASDGGVFTFGNGAHFQGSTGNLRLVRPIVGLSLG